MMRRGRTLLLLVLLIIVLSISLATLTTAPGNTIPVAPAETAAPTYRMLYTRSQQEFDHMTVHLASGETYAVESSLGFDENGKLLGVYNSLGQPLTVAGQPDFALDTTSWQMMMLAVQNLPVTASYPGLDLAACGLDMPAARIEIAYHHGETISLNVGKKTASGHSCYVRWSGDSDIHLVPADFFEVMTQPLTAHHKLPGPIRAGSSTAVQIAVLRPGLENLMITNYGTDERILPWQVDAPFVHAGSTEHIQAFVEAVSAIQADSYVTTVSAPAELAAYGLDAPTRLLVAFTDGVIRDVHVGADAGNGMLYARLDSTGDIYRIDSSCVPDLGQDGLDALLDRFLCLISAGQVKKVNVRYGEESHELSIQEAEERLAYALDGSPITSEAFAPFYTAIVGMQFDKTAQAIPHGGLLCEVQFLLADGSSAAVSYHEFDRYYLHATTTGGGEFLVRRERLDSMLNTIKEALP